MSQWKCNCWIWFEIAQWYSKFNNAHRLDQMRVSSFPMLFRSLTCLILLRIFSKLLLKAMQLSFFPSRYPLAKWHYQKPNWKLMCNWFQTKMLSVNIMLVRQIHGGADEALIHIHHSYNLCIHGDEYVKERPPLFKQGMHGNLELPWDCVGFKQDEPCINHENTPNMFTVLYLIFKHMNFYIYIEYIHCYKFERKLLIANTSWEKKHLRKVYVRSHDSQLKLMRGM